MRAWRELALANLRELIRDPGGLFLMMIFPFLMLGLVAALMLGAGGRPYSVGLHVPEGATPEVEAVVRHLEQASHLTVVPVAPEEVRQRLLSGDLSAAVILPADLDTEPVAVVVGPDQTSAGTRLRGLIRKAAGIDASRIRVVDTDGREAIENLRMMLPFTLFLSFWFLAFYSIAFHTIQLRQRGILKLLGLTPLPRITFIAGQLPARLGMALVQLVVIAAIAYAAGYLSFGRVPGFLLSALTGVVMIFSFAYLVGGVFRTPEVALVLPTALMPAIVLPSGLMLPPDTLPGWVANLSRFFPFTYWGDSLRHYLLGAPLRFSIYLSYAVMLGTTALVTLLTVRIFRWDQGEGW